MSIRTLDKVMVCRWCLRGDFDVIRHGEAWGHGEEPAGVGCLWPCNHEVLGRYDPRCLYCAPYTKAELLECPF